MTMKVLVCFCVLVWISAFGVVDVEAFFGGSLQCFKFKPQYSCSKSTSARDCDTVHTKRVCMGVRLGFAGECFNVCSYPLPQRCFCDPTLTSAESCENGLVCKPNCIQIFNFPAFCKYECEPAEIGQNCSADSMKWTKIFENDANGTPIDGYDIEALAEAIRRGADVKVYHAKYGLMTVQKATVHVNEDGETNVYVQVLHWARPPQMTSNTYIVFSTEGNFHSSQFGVNDDEVYTSRDNINQGAELTWFVRESNVLVEDTSSLSRLIRDGANVRVSLDEMEFMDLEEVSYEPVEGYVVWEMRDILYGREFNVTEQSVFRRINANGEVETSSWIFNTHERQLYETETRDVDWFVDSCWELVYRHDEAGEPVYGTYEDLTEAIRAGQRIQVRIDGVLHEANVITIRNDSEVVLHVYDNIDSDVSDATWRYLYVSTNGTVTSVDVKVGGENGTNSTEALTAVELKEVYWFADKRNWTVGAVIDNAGTAVEGDKDTLLSAYEEGADFRYMIQDGADEIYYEADLVTRVGSANIRAYHDREVTLDDSEQYVREYSFVDTNGALRYYDYLVEETTRTAAVDDPETTSKWFIGY